MPKEVIKYTDSFVTRDDRIFYNPETLKPGEKLQHTTGVSLHWDKNEFSEVQIAVTLDVESVRSVLASYDAGEWIGETEEGTLKFYTFGLKRHELQRLIKHARSARDDVFGADE